MNIERLDELFDRYKQDMLLDLCALCAIPSVHGPAEPGAPFGRENRRALDFMLRRAADFGLEALDVDGYACHVDLGQGEQTLGILCHLDVVPAGEGWQTDPFAPVLKDGFLIARGATDDKNACVLSLYALRILKEAGFPLKHRIRLVMGCDEERGSSDMAYYKQKIGMPDYGFSPDGSFPVVYAEKGIHRVELRAQLPEGGALRSMQAGTVVNVVPNHCFVTLAPADPEAARRALLAEDPQLSIQTEGGLLRLDVQGVSSHAAMPEKGVNAASRALELLARTSLGLSDGELALVRTLAKALPVDKGYDGHGLGAALADEPSGALTMNLGLLTLEKGSLCATLDIRQPVTFDDAQVLGAISKALQGSGLSASTRSYSPPLYLSKDHPLVETLLKTYRDITGDPAEPISMGGGTYARSMRNCVAFGPEGLPGETSGGMHEAGEHLCLRDFYTSGRIYLHALASLAGKA